MPQNLDLTKLSGGYKGRFYYQGNQVYECTQWSCDATITTTKDQVLDDIVDYEIPQSVGFLLKFTQLQITSALPAAWLALLQAGTFPVLSFQGSRLTLDGQEEQTQMVNCVLNGTFPIAGVQVGQTRKTNFQAAINTVPTFLSTIG